MLGRRPARFLVLVLLGVSPWLAACGATPSSTSAPAAPTPVVTQLGFSSVRCWSGAPGQYLGLACYVVVQTGDAPVAAVSADVRTFGGTDHQALIRCVACGEPGYELDLRIPEHLARGTYAIAFLVTDTKARSSAAVGTLVVQ